CLVSVLSSEERLPRVRRPPCCAGLASVRDGGSLPIRECETRIEPRCAFSPTAVVWENEYFCIVTGDRSDRCSGAVTSLGSSDKRIQMQCSKIVDNKLRPREYRSLTCQTHPYPVLLRFQRLNRRRPQRH